MGHPKVICIVGPTASGKSALGVLVARAVEGEVISADSRQVYRGLDIGSGKITHSEMGGVPHHLLDVADPKNVFTASDFAREGSSTVHTILSRKHIPIVVGGTGFYIDALLGGVSLPEVPPNEALRLELEKKTLDELQNLLKEKDPERFLTIDIKNPRRLVRAIEIAEALGKNPPPAPESPYNILWIGLALPTNELMGRIRTRLQERINAGMIDEAKRLHDEGLSFERMEHLGLEYRYLARFLTGKLTREQMAVELEKEIVQYAKRQMTWFKKNKNIQWFHPRELETIVKTCREFVKET